MKNIDSLINGLYTMLSGVDASNNYLGLFDSTTKAIAFNEIPIEYELPKNGKCFMVYALETTQAKSSETKIRLSDTVLKIFISGDSALALSAAVSDALDGSIISTFHCSYLGMNIMPNGNITIRFNLI
ncbi:hypothetical protein [Deinococcus aquaticus]|uniref:DUF3168 domain-containing protein n=1 Tax=Deinococcus aquaticus TaxID=328692 RepID=A0ABY7UZ89_9DEIO|nr:hypothetical protein [Deinococcus aquaticus]WDA58165.1 hypothetical protein M8445_12520 [Deinococcus aquaticus]